MNENKYFLWSQRGDGWSHDDWVRYHGLAISKYLNRAAILFNVIVDPYHNMLVKKGKFSQKIYNSINPLNIRKGRFKTGADIYDPKYFYNIEKINKIVNVRFASDLPKTMIDEVKDKSLAHNISVLDFNKKYNSKYLILDKILITSECFSYKYAAINHYYENILEIVNNLEYSPKIKSIAKKIIGNLGDYDAIHVRRGDSFSFPRIWGASIEERKNATDLSLHIDKIKKVIKPGRKIYISTDEPDLSFFDVLREYYDIYFRQNFEEMLKKEIPENCYNIYYLLCIEEEIMSQAYRFMGTVASSITLAVDWMRRDIGGIDKRIYHTDPLVYMDYIKSREEDGKTFLMRSPSYAECLERIFV